MAYINSNKNGIIIQPITLQIRVPFQFLTNQKAIKRTHYSEPRDGLNGCCSFSVVCAAREQTLGLVHPTQTLHGGTDFTSFSSISLPLFQVPKATCSMPFCLIFYTVQFVLMLRPTCVMAEKAGEIDL